MFLKDWRPDLLSHIFIGVLAGLVLGIIGGDSLSFWIFVSVLFSLWPDIDSIIFVIFLWLKKGSIKRALATATGRWAHEHRNILHIPLLLIPFGVLVSTLWSAQLAGVFVLLSLGHFVLDSVGIGWGVRWLYPFTRRQWKLHNGKIQSWTPDEVKNIVAIEGRDDWFIHKT